MDSKAQGSLEYLLTYGWALILVVTVVTILVFVIMPPASSVVFYSNDPSKILITGAVALGGEAEIRMQNITGGKIEVTNISLTGYFSDSDSDAELNGRYMGIVTPANPTTVMPGGELHLTGIEYDGDSGEITIDYTDYADLPRSVVIVAKGIPVS